ncbi:translocation/assembly module TamB [cyanobiont of Ornithocercus magnificus]|nr:translocation/assembly module TamB [cyanobiont of Ornithocercus magnificus]
MGREHSIRALRRWQTTAAIVSAGVILSLGINRSISLLYKHICPILEDWIAVPLGHPVELGSFLGLHPWGFTIGPVRMLPKSKSSPEVLLNRLELSLLPLESLRRWRPVARMSVHDARVDLKQGLQSISQVFGSPKKDSMPNLDLYIRFDSPAHIYIQTTGLRLTATARLVVQLAENWAGGEIQLSLPSNGQVWLSGRGRWNQLDFDLNSKIERLQLQPFQQQLPITDPLRAFGQISGALQLRAQNNRFGCRGGISLTSLRLQGKTLKEVLKTPETRLTCRDDRLSISKSRWAYGSWRVMLAGGLRLNRSYGIDFSLEKPGDGHSFQGRLDGPWQQPRFRLNGDWVLRQYPLNDKPSLRLELDGDWRDIQRPTVNLKRLGLQAAGVNIHASGSIYPELGVTTNHLLVEESAWRDLPLVSKFLGDLASIHGKLALSGPTNRPTASLTASQAKSALLANWSLRSSWSASDSLARLEYFRSPHLFISAELPLLINEDVKPGNLFATLDVNSFPLRRLSPLLDITTDGTLSLAGNIHGPLNSIKPDLNLELINPRVGNLRLLERWAGRFNGSLGIGGILQMSHSAATQGSLKAHLGSNWLLQQVQLNRQGGTLSVAGSPTLYRWRAKNLPLKGIELMLPLKQQFSRVDGQLNGSGDISLQPLLVQGKASLHRLSAIGVEFQRIFLSGQYNSNHFHFSGELSPPGTGYVNFNSSGQRGGSLTTTLKASSLDTRWLASVLMQIPKFKNSASTNNSLVTNLRSTLTNSFRKLLEDFPKDVQKERKTLTASYQGRRTYSKLGYPEELRGQINAEISIWRESHHKNLGIDLQARGHLWTEEQNQDRALQNRPFLITIRGSLQEGKGEFFLLQFPISLITIIAPMPGNLQGSLSMRGRYRLGLGSPELRAELKLEKAKVGSFGLTLERGQISLVDNAAVLNLALRGSSSRQSVVLIGQVPLSRQKPLDVRLECYGDALRFLTGFAEDVVEWRSGSTSLKISLGGKLSNPKVNGLLILKDGIFRIGEQLVSEAQASIIFNLDKVYVEELSARIGSQGTLVSQGTLSLLQPTFGQSSLMIRAKQLQLSLPIATVNLDGDLQITGAVIRPQIGGQLIMSNGLLTPTRSVFVKRDQGTVPILASKASMLPGEGTSGITTVDIDDLLEENWDFQKILVLLGADAASPGSYTPEIRAPDITAIHFDGLRLQLGPNLRVRVAPVADFRAAGFLTLNGPLDANLELQGVVRLLGGRVSLFTTVFMLDQSMPNVAVFTPSLGLIPYVDLAMGTRVSESINDVGNDAIPTQIFDNNGSGDTGISRRLQLVQVAVTGSGPANLLAENIRLRSSPPMPRSQLLSLIGGNSLAGLSSAGAGTALATMLGQSVLSPVLGTFGEFLSQRLQFAIYPTYITPKIQAHRERISGQIPPRLAMVADAGFSITDGLEFSTLSIPNRSDIAPQAMLSYRLSENMSIFGSVNNEGSWQTQLQLFLRF